MSKKISVKDQFSSIEYDYGGKGDQLSDKRPATGIEATPWKLVPNLEDLSIERYAQHSKRCLMGRNQDRCPAASAAVHLP
jgi:hypothetical protein